MQTEDHIFFALKVVFHFLSASAVGVPVFLFLGPL